jgi:hypothetical protein
MAWLRKPAPARHLFLRLFPGAAVTRPVRRRRAQHARAKSEASLAGEHGGARVRA